MKKNANAIRHTTGENAFNAFNVSLLLHALSNAARDLFIAQQRRAAHEAQGSAVAAGGFQPGRVPGRCPESHDPDRVPEHRLCGADRHRAEHPHDRAGRVLRLPQGPDGLQVCDAVLPVHDVLFRRHDPGVLECEQPGPVRQPLGVDPAGSDQHVQPDHPAHRLSGHPGKPGGKRQARRRKPFPDSRAHLPAAFHDRHRGIGALLRRRALERLV